MKVSGESALNVFRPTVWETSPSLRSLSSTARTNASCCSFAVPPTLTNTLRSFMLDYSSHDFADAQLPNGRQRCAPHLPESCHSCEEVATDGWHLGPLLNHAGEQARLLRDAQRHAPKLRPCVPSGPARAPSCAATSRCSRASRRRPGQPRRGLEPARCPRRARPWSSGSSLAHRAGSARIRACQRACARASPRPIPTPRHCCPLRNTAAPRSAAASGASTTGPVPLNRSRAR